MWCNKETLDALYLLEGKIEYKSDIFFNNSKNLRNSNIEYVYSDEEDFKFKKSVNDINYFIEKFIKIPALGSIKLYESQKNVLKQLQDKQFLFYKCDRQCGTTTLICAYILWLCLISDNKKTQIHLVERNAERFIHKMRLIRYMYENLPYYLKPGLLNYTNELIVFDTSYSITKCSNSPNGLFIDKVQHIFISDNVSNLNILQYLKNNSNLKYKFAIFDSNLLELKYIDIIENSKESFHEETLNRRSLFKDSNEYEKWKKTVISNMGSSETFYKEYELSHKNSIEEKEYNSVDTFCKKYKLTKEQLNLKIKDKKSILIQIKDLIAEYKIKPDELVNLYFELYSK